MSISIGGGISIVTSPDGHGYLHVGLDIHLGSLLDISLNIDTFPGGSSIAPSVGSPLIPSPSVAGGLLDQLLPPIIAPVVDSLLGAIPSGGVGAAQEPPAGSSTLLDLGGTLINLPGAFKES
ncbi:hypothetical protein SAMN04488038_102222 [Solimonas aquatica]|uniref:Uncharacterized protein n=1 Tax=Solimonas aquatica TaxID=489703 RepID=A0A1H9BVF1_9GAMM|nr:hypothetical protein [Solimonas aquatica]SEP92328.1 hypothetical protein SAMN04488038_102222 [Solimonas aquatica]